MGLIYLIEICDSIITILCVIGSITGILGIKFAVDSIDDDVPNPLTLKWFKGLILTTVLCLVTAAFIPSTAAGYRIAAIGTTMEYFQNSKEAKQLPDNTFKMLNRVINQIEQDSTTVKK